MTDRDERDALLDELSGYGSVSIREDQYGFCWVDFEETEFVQEYGCNEIGLKVDNGTGFYTPYWPQLSDIPRGSYENVFRTDVDISTEYNNDLGSIKALLYHRGDSYGRYSDMATAESYSKIQDSALQETEAEIDVLFHTMVTTLNNLFCPNTETDSDITYTDANGQSVTIPAGTKILDTENCPVGVDGKLPPQELFTRIGCDRYTTITADDGNTYYLYNEEDPSDSSTMYQIGSVQINQALQQQESLLPCYTQNGAVDYPLGADIIAAWESNCMTITPDDNAPCTFENYYNKMISNLGTKGNVYYSKSSTLEATVSSLDSQRSQVIGVSSDEELTKMIKYQAAYNAASRYITVISEMTELIVTGLT
jgi:flagellar hook-associated protein 1 FlgK